MISGQIYKTISIFYTLKKKKFIFLHFCRFFLTLFNFLVPFFNKIYGLLFPILYLFLNFIYLIFTIVFIKLINVFSKFFTHVFLHFFETIFVTYQVVGESSLLNNLHSHLFFFLAIKPMIPDTDILFSDNPIHFSRFTFNNAIKL